MLSHILSVGQCYIYRSHCATLSVTKTELVLMCLVRLEQENLSLFSKSMALLFFCISLVCAKLYPCSYMKYIEHSILAMESYTSIRSSFIEIFTFIFLLEKLDTINFTRDTMEPVCPLQYSYTPYEACTHHFTTAMPLELNMSFSSLVILIYLNTSFIFTQ